MFWRSKWYRNCECDRWKWTSYSWSNGQTTNVANNLGEGAYQCTTTDLNGCQVVSNIQITTPPELSAIIQT